MRPLVGNLLDDEEQELGHVFDVELRQRREALGDVRVQRQAHAAFKTNYQVRKSIIRSGNFIRLGNVA